MQRQKCIWRENLTAKFEDLSAKSDCKRVEKRKRKKNEKKTKTHSRKNLKNHPIVLPYNLWLASRTPKVLELWHSNSIFDVYSFHINYSFFADYTFVIRRGTANKRENWNRQGHNLRRH